MQKKLNAAEIATIQYTHLYVAFKQLIILYSRYSESSTDIGMQISKEFAEKILLEFYDSLNNLIQFTAKIEESFNKYMNDMDTKNEKDSYATYLKAEDELDLEMKRLSEKFELFNLELKKQIKVIRSEMSRYEYL